MEGNVYVTIYLDLVMFICFIFNGAILYVVSYIVKKKRTFVQLLLGTTFATSFVPIVVYLPHSFFNTIFGKVLYSILIILITIGIQPIHRLFKSVLTFYIVSFIAGGALLSIHYMLDYSAQEGLRPLLLYVDNMYHTEVSLVVLFVGFPLMIVLTKMWSDKLLITNFSMNQLYDVTISWNKRQFTTVGFLDSGNHLVDPLTNRPVVICDALFMKQFFTESDWALLENAITNNELERLPIHLQKKLSIIPVTTVVNSHYIYAIKPDKLIVQMNGHRIVTTNVFVGIQLSSMTSEHQYHCLLHPQLIVLSPTELAR